MILIYLTLTGEWYESMVTTKNHWNFSRSRN